MDDPIKIVYDLFNEVVPNIFPNVSIGFLIVGLFNIIGRFMPVFRVGEQEKLIFFTYLDTYFFVGFFKVQPVPKLGFGAVLEKEEGT